VEFSSDGKWVLASGPGQAILVPTGAGSIRSFRYAQFEVSWNIGLLPDGNKFLFGAIDKNKKPKLYLQDLQGGEPKGIADADAFPDSGVSPDGRFVLAHGPGNSIVLYPIAAGASRALSGIEAGEMPIQWSKDGKSIFVYNPLKLPASVFKVTLSDGRRELFKKIAPSDPTGVTGIDFVRISPDEKTYAYTYARELATLYLLDGIG
jgi:Tol biopolymer transport system component